MEILNWKDVQHVNDICVMAPTLQLAEKAEMLIKQENYQNIDVVVAASGRQETVKCAQTLAAAGAEIIITRKGTRRIVEEVTNLKVVSLNNSLSDYLWMLKERGLHTPGLIAFFSYDPMSSDILQMCEMLEVQTKNYIFKSFADCRGCVERALKDGAVFSVGGAWTDPWAKRLGLPHVIVENSVETILNALESATQLRRVQVEEAEKQCLFKTQSEMYQAVLDFTHDAILAIDENGRIQVLNPPAERIMGCRAADSVGQPVEAVLPNTLLPDVLESGEKQLDQIMQIHQTLCNTNRIPILVDGQRRGVVATFQDVKQLQNSEQKIRLKLHEKGLVAKYAFNDILGDSPAIRSTIQIARSYAASRASVLILGETGTGKELFAQSIHNASDRRDGPFVAINCAAVSNSLLESELFGYEAGSFTGASRGGREGVFELAHGGTLFLDEIGEIPRETQVELLRVLQEKEIRRVGGSRVIPVDVRIKAMVLAIPYAATIGGMATVIGTTTNPTGIGLIRETIGIDIDFLDWMKIGLPFTVILIPFFWLYMVKFFKVDKMPPTDISIARRQYEELGPMNKGEKWVAAIFVLCVILWVTRSLVWGDWFPYATDETIAMFGAILVMIAPMDYKKGEYVCDWKTGFNDIPWNAVILLGGSMVMGNAFRDAGCAEWIANMLSGLAGMNSILIVILVGIVTAVLTELTTNAVVVAAFIPVLAGVGEAIGVSPFAMMIACMLACNFAFMLPPGTPPNAIAYGSGEIELKDMLKCGLGLKLIALIIFPIVLYFITMGIFGVGTV